MECNCAGGKHGNVTTENEGSDFNDGSNIASTFIGGTNIHNQNDDFNRVFIGNSFPN